ncbi:MAG: UDP-3-O-acyl-N-acetylglucosamine deacetylase [Alphaproteobacteria bacterium]|nr:UDP-3-O-acyl-N-acetylglucosamine deacetylase [Alphaproteobacteria bacterium]
MQTVSNQHQFHPAAFPWPARDYENEAIAPLQATLKKSVSCIGVGVHSGKSSTLTLRPATVGTGYVFLRGDLPQGQNTIPARFDAVSDTRMCTTLSNKQGASISTVEHVVAALAGAGITNAIIEVNGPEVPIMDGSSFVFSQMIRSTGTFSQGESAPSIKIVKPVRVGSENAFAEFVPSENRSITMTFDAGGRLPASMKQDEFTFDYDADDFSSLLCDARTFGFYEDAAKLWAAGLAKGASLNNTVVIQDDAVMNVDGLRSHDELIRHKVLDAIGDLALAGVVIHGHFRGHNSGHALNNQLLRAVFSTQGAWTADSLPQQMFL